MHAHLSAFFRRAPGAGSASLLAFVAILSLARTAHAQRYYYYAPTDVRRGGLALGLDLEGAVPINVPQVRNNDVAGGGGVKIRVGDEIPFAGLRITPELGYGYDHLFATDDFGTSYDWNMHRAFAGVRFGFGRFLVPVVYGHVGYGWRATNDPDVPAGGGFAYDVGGALDLHIVPHFGFGAHAELAGVDSQPYTPQWLALGLHGDVVF